MKFISIVGARPQFIKVAALHRSLKSKENIDHLILHTGQHYDHSLSAIFFKELEIPEPFAHLELTDENNRFSVPLIQQKTEQILTAEKPDVVIVYGDTNTTLAGARAAKNCNIRLAHVEAGLRSFNNEMPEEYNRLETDTISDFLFCPTQTSVDHLTKEKAHGKIVLCGDIMLDAFNFYSQKATARTAVDITDFILSTLHRESVVESAEKLSEVVNALNKINETMRVIVPAHPRLKARLHQIEIPVNFRIIEPVGYLEMIGLLQRCRLVMTDSGGLQKEAFFSKKVCITLRKETEWTELVAANVNFLAGDDSRDKILAVYKEGMASHPSFEEKFYGDGNAAEIIVETLLRC
ncbi:UDP-N-acetylglucosamine 2-epimerase (non-hydrolyzing) [soil metagenome]